MGADRLQWLDDAATMFFRLREGVPNAAIGIQVEQDTLLGDLIRIDHQTAPIAILMVEHAERGLPERFFRHTDPEHGRVKPLRPIQIGDRNVEPDATIVLVIPVAHLLPSRLGS